MNLFLWILQILLAAHTAMGAAWKFSNSEAVAPALGGLPHPLWLGLTVVELLAVVALIVPAFNKRLAMWAPIGAGFVALEMLFFCAVALASGNAVTGALVYWLIVAAIAAFLAYGRMAIAPIRPSAAAGRSA